MRLGDGLTSAQSSAFTVAARRWCQLVTAGGPAVEIDGETIAGVLIDVDATASDDPSGTLGRAGPTRLRPHTFLPATGIMSFGAARLRAMESDASLVNVALHAIGHVLGFGTIFDRAGLIDGAGGDDPGFTGANAMREYAALRGAGAAEQPVPLENVGRRSTRDAHWREATFAGELMTGVVNPGASTISRLTIAALADLGYEVSYAFAGPYRPPEPEDGQRRRPGEARTGHDCVIAVPEATVLPDGALV